MKRVIVMMLAATMLVACSKNSAGEVTEPEKEGTGRVITLRSSIQRTLESRAAYSSNAEVTGLQILRKDAADKPTDFTDATLISGNRATNGSISFPEGSQKFSNNGDNAWFASYYPAGTVANGVVTWNIDGMTDILTAATMNAGSYSVTSSEILAYKHELTQIEVVCVANTAAASLQEVQARWGQIQAIKLKDTPKTVTYSYNGPAIAAGGETGHLPLVAADYTAALAAFDVPDSDNTAVNAAGMFVPTESNTLTLEVTPEKGSPIQVPINLGAGKKLLKASRWKVTLTFQPDGKTITLGAGSSSIEEWNAATGGDVDASVGDEN